MTRAAGGAHMLSAFRYGIMARVGPPSEMDMQEEWVPSDDRAARQEIERMHQDRMEMMEGM